MRVPCSLINEYTHTEHMRFSVFPPSRLRLLAFRFISGRMPSPVCKFGRRFWPNVRGRLIFCDVGGFALVLLERWHVLIYGFRKVLRENG